MDQWFEAAKGEVAVEYFSNLCKSSNPSSFEAFFCGMAPKVIAEMNADLVARIPDEEIREAVFAIKPLTAPRPDGVTVFFFKSTWMWWVSKSQRRFKISLILVLCQPNGILSIYAFCQNSRIRSL